MQMSASDPRAMAPLRGARPNSRAGSALINRTTCSNDRRPSRAAVIIIGNIVCTPGPPDGTSQVPS